MKRKILRGGGEVDIYMQHIQVLWRGTISRQTQWGIGVSCVHIFPR